MKIKSSICILLLALSTMLLLSTAKTQPAYAEQRVYLSPSNYVFTPENGTAGTLFNVTVWVSSDTYPWKLMMWQVFMTWNNSLLNVTKVWGEVTGDWTYRAWPNDNFDGRNWDPQYVFYNRPGGATGNPYYYENYPSLGLSAIKIADTLYSPINITEPKILCQIEFNIITTIDSEQQLSTILSIDNEDTYLYNDEGEIPGVIKENGQYSFIPEFAFVTLLITMITATSVVVRLKSKIRKSN